MAKRKKKGKGKSKNNKPKTSTNTLKAAKKAAKKFCGMTPTEIDHLYDKIKLNNNPLVVLSTSTIY